jgi:hypothetical protein
LIVRAANDWFVDASSNSITVALGAQITIITNLWKFNDSSL